MLSSNITELIFRLKNNDCSLKTLDFSKHTLRQDQLRELKEAVYFNSITGNVLWGEVPKNLNSRIIIREIETKLKNNILNYSIYPSPYLYGLLSLHSYYEANSGDKVKLNNIAYDNDLISWSVNKVYKNDNNGYYGVLYQNNKTCQLVLAQRGTEFLGLKAELLGNLDIATDIKGVVLNKILPPIFDTYQAVGDAVRIAKQEHQHLSFTGHSLGAWLAELSLYFSYKDFDYPVSRALTFDSPGSKEFFASVQTNIASHLTGFNVRNLDIITYLSIPNLVNSCNGHVGTVYSVTPEITQKELNIYYKEWQSSWKSYFIDADLVAPFLTVFGHSLESIINEFSSTTGLPKQYIQMLDWPCIACSYQHRDHLSDRAIDTSKNIADLTVNILLVNSLKDIPIYKLANIFLDILHNKVEVSQYLRVIKDEILPHIKEEYRSVSEQTEQSFYLKYEGHYRSTTPNSYIEPVNGASHTPNWYVEQLITHYEFFIHAPEECNLTNVVQGVSTLVGAFGTIIHPTINDKHPYGKLDFSTSKHTIDKIKQATVRLEEISEGAISKCLAVYNKPSIWKKFMERLSEKDTESITKEYIDNGGTLNLQDENGDTILNYAITNNRIPVVEMLIANGASVDIVNKDGVTIYDLAQKLSNSKILADIKQYRHIISPQNIKSIVLDEYGIYDGNESSNIFVIEPNYAGKNLGYKLVIDKFETATANKDVIDLQKFNLTGIDQIEINNATFAGKNSVRISTASQEDLVIILGASVEEVVSSVILGEHQVHQEL